MMVIPGRFGAFSDNESDDPIVLSDILLNLPSGGSSNGDLEPDSDDLNYDADDISDDEDPPFDYEVLHPPEYYIAEAESLNITQLRQQRRTPVRLDETRDYWAR
jgi:hypothetical protein